MSRGWPGQATGVRGSKEVSEEKDMDPRDLKDKTPLLFPVLERTEFGS